MHDQNSEEEITGNCLDEDKLESSFLEVAQTCK